MFKTQRQKHHRQKTHITIVALNSNLLAVQSTSGPNTVPPTPLMPADRSLPRPEEKRHWSYSTTLANPPFSLKTLNGQRFYLLGSLASMCYGIYSARKAAYLYLFSTAAREDKKNEYAARGALDSYERSVSNQMYRKIGLRGAAFLLLPFVFIAIPVRYRFIHKDKTQPAKIVQEHVR